MANAVEVVVEQKQHQEYEQQDAFEERVIEIARRRQSSQRRPPLPLSLTVVVGDKKGTVGMGLAKPMPCRMQCARHRNAREKPCM